MPKPTVQGSGSMRGKRVLVAASDNTARKLSSALEAEGAQVIRFQTTELRECADKTALETALARLGEYEWVIFTSANGVRFFAASLDAHRVSKDERGNLHVCAVGPATARAAKDSGFSVALVPERYLAEGILSALAEVSGGLQRLAGHRILLPRAKEARDLLPRELEQAGALVDIVPCYEAVPIEVSDARRQETLEGKLDLLVFTSSANLGNFVTALGDADARRLLSGTPVGVLGPIVRATALKFGKEPEIRPEESTIESLLIAIRSYFKEHAASPGGLS